MDLEGGGVGEGWKGWKGVRMYMRMRECVRACLWRRLLFL